MLKEQIEYEYVNIPEQISSQIILNITMEMPYAYLDNDVTQGWGPEIVKISCWTEVDYIIEVHDFSGESEDVSFEVEVCCGKDTLCFQRHNLKEAAAWAVFRMNRKGIGYSASVKLLYM